MQDERKAVEIERYLDDIPRRARLVEDDGGFPARKRIQEARLANVRRAHNRDPDALAKDFAAAAIGERALQLHDERSHHGQSLVEGALRDIALV